LQDKITYCHNIYEACRDANLLVILTEWSEFKDIDLEKLAGIMKEKKIFDCRNLLDKQKVLSFGYRYEGIGR
ncbi:UDP-glucose 6-dehydrogenase, partial [Campylobacter coli]|nr:UDP-glucose 6-dehydrogenase [Campylobacter coli]